MTASHFILPRALIKALGPAPDGEDLKAIIVDLAAGGRIEAVAQYVIDHRHVDHEPEHDQLVTPHQWQRIVHQNKVADVWNHGTVRLDSDLKNHLYYLEIVGIRFEEAPVREALLRYGVVLNDAKSARPSKSALAPTAVPSQAAVAVPVAAVPPKQQRSLPSLHAVIAVSVDEAAQIIGIGRTSIYARINDGTLATVKTGRRTLITSQSILEMTNQR
jgi:excisionase family DNA binding protein